MTAATVAPRIERDERPVISTGLLGALNIRLAPGEVAELTSHDDGTITVAVYSADEAEWRAGIREAMAQAEQGETSGPLGSDEEMLTYLDGLA
jgi:hypothetical protein